MRSVARQHSYCPLSVARRAAHLFPTQQKPVRVHGAAAAEFNPHNTGAVLKRSERGETITEVLVAMVVAGLAILLLATAIASAVNMNVASRESMDRYFAANNDMAEGVTAAGKGAITLTAASGEMLLLDDDTSVDVDLFVNEQSGSTPIVSYREAKEG